MSATALAPIVRAADAWPQASSDLPADPKARFGVLPNGMKYAVMRNATPAHASSLRLRIGSGSLEESDAEQGLAHVLEHMAFKGSTHVAAGDMIKMLQRLGLGFGADTNAQTGWTQTVYEFDLPHSDHESLDTGLMLMREIASELTLDPKALDSERGVVLSEERLRDTPEYRAQKAQLDLFLHDQLAARRFPDRSGRHRPARAGEPRSQVLRGQLPTRSGDDHRGRRLRSRRHGGGDQGEVRRLARAGDAAAPSRSRNRATARRDGEAGSRAGGVVRSRDRLGEPFDGSPDTSAKERREVIENLGLAVLNRRLARLARADAPPFLNAQAGVSEPVPLRQGRVVQTTAAPGGWRRALSATDVEVRRLIASGATSAELAREITEMRTQFKAAAEGARPGPARRSPRASSIPWMKTRSSPRRRWTCKLFDQAAKGLTVAEVNEAVRKVFAGAGPLVELVTPEPVEGGEATVVKAFADASARPSPRGPRTPTWPGPTPASVPPGRSRSGERSPIWD